MIFFYDLLGRPLFFFFFFFSAGGELQRASQGHGIERVSFDPDPFQAFGGVHRPCVG